MLTNKFLNLNFKNSNNNNLAHICCLYRDENSLKIVLEKNANLIKETNQ